MASKRARPPLAIALLLAGLLVVTTGQDIPPNALFGTCFDDAWVAKMEQKLGVSAADRDPRGRLVNPYLRPALKHRRYTVVDSRTAVDPDLLYNATSCMPADGVYYGAGSRMNGSKLVDRGRIKDTLIVELKTWASSALVTDVFGILAQEMLGYDVSIYLIPNSDLMAQRMSSVQKGVCSPVHANVEVWTDSKRDAYDIYANETWVPGGIGYFGRSGLYTTRDFVKRGTNASRYSPIFDADFYRDYTHNEDLLGSLPVSSLWNNSKYWPPSKFQCADGVLGCKNHCSKSYACTLREAKGKECIVTVMMKSSYDLGYLQAVMSNTNIPTYFCFIGYTNALNYAVEAVEKNEGVLFYHYEPDTFFFENPNKFERVFLPRTTPEEVALHTRTFGEKGYGNATTNPIKVDFPTMRLDKFAPIWLQDQQPIASFLSSFTVTELMINKMLTSYMSTLKKPKAEVPDPAFTTACSWLKDNYDVWKLWLNRLPICTFKDHIKFTIEGCDESTQSDASDASESGEISIQTIRFAWRFPDPENTSMSYECDGGYWTLPSPLRTSRPCAWLKSNQDIWSEWIDHTPKCTADFMTYKVTECGSNGQRRAIFSWKYPKEGDPTQSAECSGGVKLNNDVVLPCDYVPWKSGAFIVVIIVCCIVLLLLAAGMAFVFFFRTRPIVKRSQFEFLMLMISGGVLLCIAVLVYAGAPTRFLCAARPTFIALGFTMIFGSLVVKSLRVYRVFSSQAMKRVVLSTKVMFKMFMVFVAVDCIVLIAWFAVDFPEPTVSYTQMLELNGGSYGSLSCKSSSFIFSALLIFWKAIVLAMGLYLSFLIRNLSNDFQESIWIFASSVVVLFGSLVMLPMAYLVTLDAIPFYMFLAFSLLFCTVLVMSMMLVPKAFRLNEESKSSNAMLPPEKLSPGARRVCVALAVVLHAGYASIYGYEARQYYLQSFVNSELQNAYARALGIAYTATRARSLTMCITSSLITAWHSARILNAAIASGRHRDLLLSDPTLVGGSPPTMIVTKLRGLGVSFRHAASSQGQPTVAKSTSRWRRKCVSLLQRLRQAVGRAGTLWRTYFTIDGEHYETGTELRELLEILTQLNVVRHMTQIVVNDTLTDNVTSALVINCWSTPLLRALFRNRSVTVNRVGRLVAGMLIATCFTILVPFLAWTEVNDTTSREPTVTDPRGPANFRAATHLAFKEGWLDIVSSRVAAGMAIMALNAVGRKVALDSSCTRRHEVVSEPPKLAPPTAEPSRRSSSDDDDDSDADSPPMTAVQPTAPTYVTRPVRSKVYDFISILTGIFVLAVHIEAKLRHTNEAPTPGLTCLRLVHPWATLRWPCSVLEVNCHRAGVIGKDEELVALLDYIDTASLTYVRFTHCAALEMPSQIQQFANLAHLELFNVTLAKWGEDAALLRSLHPRLGRLWLLGVRNMTTFPAGITVPGFPAVDISVCLTDLSELPSDLDARWPSVMTSIGLETTALTTLPPALMRMNAYSYQLSGNQLTSIPADITRRRVVTQLSLASNVALSELPDGDWIAIFLDIRSTNVSRLPNWAHKEQARPNFQVLGATDSNWMAVITAAGTPFCNAQRSLDPTLTVLRLPSALVDCVTPPPVSMVANCSIPLEHLAVERPV
ncbi:hypothetical protein ATCC90586_006688 [Pythium insidiosum]|nr:hypothetical protein ATCC90586_006688 [Pythium insidiosum]